MSGRRICSIDVLADGEAVAVEFDGRVVLAVRLDDRVHVIDELCSHQAVSLLDGEIDRDECTIECPKHGAAFRLEDGVPVSLPATRPIGVLAVEVVGDDVRLVEEP